MVDNTFGTPYFIRPIEHGADVVVHSATKFLGGHGTTLGGIIVDGGAFDWKASGRFPPIGAPNPSYHGVCFADAAGPAALTTYIRAILLRDTGAAISPFNAFLLLQGIETLSLRLDRHAENTRKMVEYLSRHPKVERVNHPSLAGHPDHSLYRRYFPGRRLHLHRGSEGGTGGGLPLHRPPEAVLPAGQRGRLQEPGHPPRPPPPTPSCPPKEQAEQGILPGTVRLSIGTEHGDDCWPTWRRPWNPYKYIRRGPLGLRRRLSKKSEDFSDSLQKCRYFCAAVRRKSPRFACRKPCTARFPGHLIPFEAGGCPPRAPPALSQAHFILRRFSDKLRRGPLGPRRFLSCFMREKTVSPR